MELSNIIYVSFTNSLNILSSSYAHFEKLGSSKLEILILVISHVVG